jgi:hypothetical protein
MGGLDGDWGFREVLLLVAVGKWRIMRRLWSRARARPDEKGTETESARGALT